MAQKMKGARQSFVEYTAANITFTNLEIIIIPKSGIHVSSFYILCEAFLALNCLFPFLLSVPPLLCSLCAKSNMHL